MVKDETNVEEGTVEEEDLLDFDLDDLASEEGTEPGEDEEIIELVDLVEEDAVEDAGGEAADIEMLLQDEVSPGTSDEEAGEA
ncbi:MAG: hypothetical protein K9M82_11730, partial [Deltaproteobacteria bacterium]|nr:hypothetical protein [Deltaproteobacteria bacterium]